jgi:hypothetical protein
MSIARRGTPNWTLHPGEVLREEFLKPMAMSPYALAKRLRVPPRHNRRHSPSALPVFRNHRAILAKSAGCL